MWEVRVLLKKLIRFCLLPITIPFNWILNRFVSFETAFEAAEMRDQHAQKDKVNQNNMGTGILIGVIATVIGGLILHFLLS